MRKAMNSPSVANIFSLTTKRVTDLVLEQSRQAFRHAGVALDAKMISIITLLHQQGPLTSTALSERTGLSRQLVESRLRQLVKDRYLEEDKDPDDLRRRVYAIASDKMADVSLAIKTVASFEDVYEALWIELGFDLQQGLRDLETQLNRKKLVDRLADMHPETPSNRTETKQ
jgi:DNA-binding MarR family transcriptional regulator